ncbi:MAG: GNAT family N-acetyltransferase [Cyanobacteria bacterium]|nr:GNAT family N-acetyltransferase [Cyanobacteriota bacterium]MDW8203087.1 GNAT family N-acetyltransferase [Cyanobacteriota bacterium SKYGB_h_bin112]
MISFSHSSYSPTVSTIAPPTPITIRVAQYRDLPGLATLLVDSFHSHHGFLRLLRPILRLGAQEDLRLRLGRASSSYLCLVAVTSVMTRPATLGSAPRAHEQVVGTIELTVQTAAPRHSHQGQYLYISSLAVHRHYRRCGIARQLLVNCEKTARIMGFSDLYLHVIEGNKPAQALYQRMGYQLERYDPDLLALLPGQPQRLLLRKHLPKLSPTAATPVTP